MADAALNTNERRHSLRRNVNRPGRLVVEGGRSIDCLVRNISDGGALISVHRSEVLPDNVTLVVPDLGVHRMVRVKWRRTYSVGVAF